MPRLADTVSDGTWDRVHQAVRRTAPPRPPQVQQHSYQQCPNPDACLIHGSQHLRRKTKEAHELEVRKHLERREGRAFAAYARAAEDNDRLIDPDGGAAFSADDL